MERGTKLFGLALLGGVGYWVTRLPDIKILNNAGAGGISFKMSWEGESVTDTILPNDPEQVIAAGGNRFFISSADSEGATLTIATDLKEDGTYIVVSARSVAFAGNVISGEAGPGVHGIGAGGELDVSNGIIGNFEYNMEIAHERWAELKTEKTEFAREALRHNLKRMGDWLDEIKPANNAAYEVIAPSNAILEYKVSRGGKYYVVTNQNLTGQGITQTGDGSSHARGLSSYSVTENALKKLISLYPSALYVHSEY